MKKIVITISILFLLIACGSSTTLSYVQLKHEEQIKTGDINEETLKLWHHMDYILDTIPGISTNRAYNLLLKERKSSTTIVAIIDSGIDINHKDLNPNIWTNSKEKPGNGKDDDKNGYIDDVHGWNFLGNTVYENLEFTRIIKKGNENSDSYKKANETLKEKLSEVNKNLNYYTQLELKFRKSDSLISDYLKKENYALDDLKAIKSDNKMISKNVDILSETISASNLSISEIKSQLKEGVNYFNDQVKYHLNVNFTGHTTGDNKEDFSNYTYGNNDVIGLNLDESLHGTHVAGIIGAIRNNNIGINGIANDVKIMPIRAVPNGDEYDKDIAAAIYYAVNNGAHIINASFGKSFSPFVNEVQEAIKYAASKDVLIVHAAGNDFENIDEKISYPTDALNVNQEISNNFISVGAINSKYGKNMIAPFSNYGKQNVDVFAPGVGIWSTTPENNYEFLSGTSMAAPVITSIAAIIKSYFPKLKAHKIKDILIQSGLKVDQRVEFNEVDTKHFSELSRSGRIANLYNAFLMAEKYNLIK